MKSTYVEFVSKNNASLNTEEVAIDNLGPNHVVMKNEATMISAGTELSSFTSTDPKHFPARSGYAAIGRVIAKGLNVTDFNVGDRAFYAGNHCSVQRFEHNQDHQWGRLYPVPEGIESTDAAIVCLTQIASTAPLLSHVDPGDTVAVFGLGVIGNLCAQIYKNMGANVIGLDPVAKRCEVAKIVGIDTVVSVPADQQVEAVKKLTNGKGADITVDAVGHSAVVKNCVYATSLFGQVLLLGTPRAPVDGSLTDIFQDIHLRGIIMRGAHMWQFPAMDTRGAKKTVPWGYRLAFDWIMKGKIQIKPLLSHKVKPDRAHEVYNGLIENRDQYWGVVFDWQ